MSRSPGKADEEPGSPRILVVDDDPLILRAVERYLRQEGWHVVSVGSSDEALEQLRRSRYDVVLSDLQLGEGSASGLAVLEAARTLAPSTGRVLMTGSFAALGGAMGNHPAQATVGKPMELARLITALESVLPPRARPGHRAP